MSETAAQAEAKPIYDEKARDFHIPGLVSYEGDGGEKTVTEQISFYTANYGKDGDSVADPDARERLDRKRAENPAEMVRSFYNLITDFYEYGYGQSFHFAPVYDDMTFNQFIAEYERGIGKTLEAGPEEKILDVGCGVGGPAREIASHLGTNIVGLNYNDYQLRRARDHTKNAGLDGQVSYVQGDFCNMKDFEDNSFDGAYCLEATCHAKDPTVVYKEIFRVLKPGAQFVESAWALTDNFDPENPEHVKVSDGIAYGNGLPDLKPQKKILDCIRAAGFEVVGFRNCHREGDKPWYDRLEGKGCTFQNFRISAFGRMVTHSLLTVLETVRLVPKGTTQVHSVLQVAASALITGGKLDIFTPLFRVVVRKPLEL